MEELIILGVLVQERENHALKLQNIFTKYGCTIKTRLGLNEVDLSAYKNAGLIILELTGDPEECIRLENELLSLDGVEVKKMIF